MRSRIANFGVFLALLGILSSALTLFGYELRVLRGLDELGPMAWVVRGGLIVVGVVIFFVAAPKDESAGASGEGQAGSGPGAAPERSPRDSFASDPRFQHLGQYMQGRFATTFDAPTTPDVFQIVHVACMTAEGAVVGQADPSARYAIAYLKRGAEPSRMQVSLDLATGQCGEAPLGWMQWKAVVP
jgi:hypothetical protein